MGGSVAGSFPNQCTSASFYGNHALPKLGTSRAWTADYARWPAAALCRTIPTPLRRGRLGSCQLPISPRALRICSECVD